LLAEHHPLVNHGKLLETFQTLVKCHPSG
jgi:hypothetical protein